MSICITKKIFRKGIWAVDLQQVISRKACELHRRRDDGRAALREELSASVRRELPGYHRTFIEAGNREYKSDGGDHPIAKLE